MDIKHCKRIGLIVKPQDERGIPIAQTLIAYLLKRFDNVIVDRQDDALLSHKNVSYSSRQKFAEQCDLVISLGGDGTLLSAARTVVRHQVPLLGINLGTLGFLVEISPADMQEQLDAVFSGEFRIEERLMLTASCMHGGRVFAEHDVCNDVVIKHQGLARMIELDTAVDDVFINEVWSDGLIVATPTGSTAYALASGGPLVEPTLSATLIVPICPHTLSYRPLIVDGNKPIEITYTEHNQDNSLVSVDGQINEVIKPGCKVVVKALPLKLQLIQPRQHDYFSTLRTKLRWSEKL